VVQQVARLEQDERRAVADGEGAAEPVVPGAVAQQ